MKGVAPVHFLSSIYIGRYMNAWEFRTRNCARICLAALIEYSDIQMRPFHVGLVEWSKALVLKTRAVGCRRRFESFTRRKAVA